MEKGVWLIIAKEQFTAQMGKQGGKNVEKREKGIGAGRGIIYPGEAVGKPGGEKRGTEGARPGLLPFLLSLEGERVILTVPLGRGKGDERET